MKMAAAAAAARSSSSGRRRAFARALSHLTTISLALLTIASCLSEAEARLLHGDEDFYEKPGVLSVEILRARGYLAEEKYFATPDNYVIRLTRATNPLIRGGAPGGLPHRAPILFIHGILEADNVFVINSFGVQPRDLSNVTLLGGDQAQVERQLASQEPSSRSMPLLALNMGHEVWLMSRRGFPGSQELLGDPTSISAKAKERSRRRQAAAAGSSGSTPGGTFLGPLTSVVSGILNWGAALQQVPFSFDRKFWNFSFDEQARFDLPAALEFICNETKRPKIHLVGHSAGGAIQLMAMSLFPQLADRIASSILWSQGFSLGHDDAFAHLRPLLPLLETYIGSVPPAFTVGQFQTLTGLICASPIVQRTLCEGVADLFLGYSAGRQPLRPEYLNTLLYPSSSHELAQNIQMVGGGHMRAFNYGPFYNASNIRLQTMSFYAAATDRTVSPADVRATLPLLKVPYRYKLIDEPFNHNGFFYHNDNALLVIIPSLRDIHQFEAAGAARATVGPLN